MKCCGTEDLDGGQPAGGGGAPGAVTLQAAITGQAAVATSAQAFATTIGLGNTFSWVWVDAGGANIVRIRGDGVANAFEVQGGANASSEGQGISIRGGNATLANRIGGPVLVEGGTALGISQGGLTTVSAGDADPAGTGTGGVLQLGGGDGGGLGGSGGPASLGGGAALAGNSDGGNTFIFAGAPTGTGLAGMVQITYGFAWASIVTPGGGALAASINDYSPTNMNRVITLRLTPNAAGTTITGIATGRSGRMIQIVNLSATQTIQLTNDDAASVAANRFLTPSASTYTIPPQAFATLVYDGTALRWRIQA